MSEPVWKAKANEKANEVRVEDWKSALTKTAGNISAAAKEVKIARSHGTRLNKKFALVEFAAELRLKAGAARVRGGERKGTVTGRPRKG